MNCLTSCLSNRNPTQSDHEYTPLKGDNGTKYTLEQGVSVCDKTNGVGKVVFSSKLTQEYGETAYEVFIARKGLILPTCADPSSGPSLVFTKCHNITFELENGFIKITKKEEDSNTVFYVDPTKTVKKWYNIFGSTYAYTYIPKDATRGDLQKVEKLKQTTADTFNPDMVVHNRHGVAVFGNEYYSDESELNDPTKRAIASIRKKKPNYRHPRGYALYWASPSDTELQKVDCSSCVRYKDGGTSIAQAKDGKVDFRYLAAENAYYLNRELATLISM